MQFKQGADVYTSSGDKVGAIDRVVIDPESKEVTHVVVQKGFLLKDDKVVPIDMIGPATADRVTLRQGVQDIEQLPDLVEAHYIPIDDEEAGDGYEDGGARPWYWYPPISGAWWGRAHFVYGRPRYVLKTEENIPEGTIALKEGARVFSRDGNHVGNLERVFTEAQENRATHLVISEGLLFKDRKLIPTDWISTVRQDDVQLSVTESLIESLPEYQPLD